MAQNPDGGAAAGSQVSLARAQSKGQALALLYLRLIVAAIFFFAAYAKWSFWASPPAGFSGGMLYVIGFLSIAEPLGALALVGGFLTRWAASGLAIIMLGAVFVLRFNFHTAFFTAPQGAGLDYNLLILGGCLALLAFGAGQWSLDALRRKGIMN